MRNIRSKPWLVVLLLLLAHTLATTASAQTCLSVDACLFSPTRSDAGRPISVNGCSVPPEAGTIGQFWAAVFESACNQHDADWGTFNADLLTWFAQSNAAFYANMLAICQARVDIPTAQCLQAANIFVYAVSETSIGQNVFKRAQYFASSCACQQLPTAPANLTAQVTSGPAGAQVTLEWTPGVEATSYAVEVVQPLLAPIDTGSPQPIFVASGVPSGQYRVQVRAVNPLGVSSPSNVADVVVTPCTAPLAPSLPTATFANGVAVVSWQPVTGATSYIVQAGSEPGGSDIFSGNVGNTTAVTASGLPSGFHAFVRVFAVSACGISAASAEVEIGSATGGLLPPANLTASIVGNTVTLQWSTPSGGVTPTGYVLEGGLVPGEVLASVPIQGPAQTFTLIAPTGTFYVRLHATLGGLRSAASNEIQIQVGLQAATPQAFR